MLHGSDAKAWEHLLYFLSIGILMEGSMARNICDMPVFFAGYRNLNGSVQGLKGAPEWPSIKVMLPVRMVCIVGMDAWRLPRAWAGPVGEHADAGKDGYDRSGGTVC